jgi:hypothetical protein
MFLNRKLLIATKHNKEEVIAPLFEQQLGVSCFVTDVFDTDTLGTFSGEVQRKDDALSTLRNKCLLAMERNNCELVIASEGSFGAHPSVFFAPADEEFIMLVDKRNQLEIVVRELSMDTNFSASKITSQTELLEFASRAQFPSHGLIMKPSENNYSRVVKGITNHDELKKNFEEFKNDFGSVYVETDMRANFNPSRMKVIENTAKKLLEAVQSKCPNCEFPGFVVTDALPGLPCSWCNCATRSTLCFLYTCKKCEFTKEVFYPHEKTKEDPAYCDFCNP